jgi:hypothetical protein
MNIETIETFSYPHSLGFLCEQADSPCVVANPDGAALARCTALIADRGAATTAVERMAASNSDRPSPARDR